MDNHRQQNSNNSSKQTDQTSTKRAKQHSDIPLRQKATLLVLIAAAWGITVGMLTPYLKTQPWLVIIALFALLVLMTTCRRWVSSPMDNFMTQVRRTFNPQRPLSADSLPSHRTDEIGELARILQQLSRSAHRSHLDATQLRRTLDNRVNQATRRATAKLSQLVMRDPMTNLGNRRFLDENLRPLFDSCKESNTDLACVIIDMDNFKQVNDNLGHQTGDDLIRFTGSLIRATIRHEDCAVRYGGDEFLVLMPGANQDRAKQFAQHISDLYEAHTRTTLPNARNLKLSIGIASLLHNNITNGDELIRKADALLYIAKRKGKGRIQLTIAESA